MSYDIMVFEKGAAPEARKDFLFWFERKTQWNEGHDYNNPDIASSQLKGWYFEMIKTFPAMNGPYASSVETEYLTGYTIGKEFIYVDFRWSLVDEAFDTSFGLAKKYQLGFYHVSSDEGEIYIPVKGDLILESKNILEGSEIPIEISTFKKSPWWQFWKKKISKTERNL